MRKGRKASIDLTTFEGRIAKQGYHQVGKHSAVKICKYSHDALLGKESCYKNRFYGLSSHQCLQCSPVLQFCNLSCRFCWRLIPETKTGWLQMPPAFQWEDAKSIADGMILEQKRIMSGYKGNPKALKQRALDAMQPKHVALSLIGEPTMYPKMSELLSEFHKRKMSTFLVTNGTLPKALEALTVLPTQLYISMVAPDEKSYAHVTQQTDAAAKMLWKNYLQSLDYLAAAGEKTRTVLRMTLSHNLNDFNPDGYAQLIKRGKPHYVEVKSMVFVGFARNAGRGLQLGDMLTIEEIREFAKKLADLSGYIAADEHIPSRIVLLCRDEKTRKEKMIDFDAISA